MGYEKLGRKLGVGTRVAAKMLRERTQKAGSPAQAKSPNATRPSTPSPPKPQRVGRLSPALPIDPRAATRDVTGKVARGSRGFGRGFWGPFAHATRALWHEITGVFFAIFAVFFGQGVWRHRNAWLTGPEHAHFVIYLVITLLFAYFSFSAFATSRRSQH